MTLYNAALADRGCRLARKPHSRAPVPLAGAPAADASGLRAPAALSSEPRTPLSVRVQDAPVAPPPATGAVPLLQSSAAVEARAAHNRQVTGSTPVSATRSEDAGVASADARHLCNPMAARGPDASAVFLSDHAMVLLRAVAAYERCDNGRAIVIALADYVQKIGAGPLARAVLDSGYTLPEQVDGGGGNTAIPATLLDGEDIAGVPEYRRVGETRFPKGGGP